MKMDLFKKVSKIAKNKNKSNSKNLMKINEIYDRNFSNKRRL